MVITSAQIAKYDKKIHLCYPVGFCRGRLLSVCDRDDFTEIHEATFLSGEIRKVKYGWTLNLDQLSYVSEGRFGLCHQQVLIVQSADLLVRVLRPTWEYQQAPYQVSRSRSEDGYMTLWLTARWHFLDKPEWARMP